jgi:hypothetical protein
VETYKLWLASAESVTAILEHCQQQMQAMNVVRNVHG